MCLFYAKLIVIFHVGTKWFAFGKPSDLLMLLRKLSRL